MTPAHVLGRRVGSGTQGHDMCLIVDDDAFNRVLTRRVSDGLEADEVCVVIATAEHREALRSSVGTSLHVAEQTGRYFEFDAEDTLHRVAPDGEPDRELFDQAMGNLLRGVCFDGRTVHAYGEMVGLLCDDGNVSGALALEDLWNELRDQIPFSLLCGYSVTAFELGDGSAEIRTRHDQASTIGCPAAR